MGLSMRVYVDKAELSRLRASLPPDHTHGLQPHELIELAARALENRDARRAIDLTQAALVLDPDNAVALRLVGEALVLVGDRHSAQRAFERAILEDPNDWHSACELARLHAAAGRHDEARSIAAMLTSNADVPSDVLATLAREVTPS